MDPTHSPSHIAKHLREFYFGPNWTGTCFTEVIEGISYVEANEKLEGFNTILALTYHIHYYVKAALDVLQGKPLTALDKYSFDHPKISNEAEWQALLQTAYDEARKVADLIEQLPESQLWEAFADPKYGSYYRNLQGTVEHSQYHLGQISLLKKMLKR